MAWRGNLDRCYGFFRCNTCHSDWESSHVYCQKGTTNPKYKQDCKKCNQSYLPYKVEAIKCAICGQTREFCDCIKDQHHVDPNKPHRRDLCEKCRSGNPCA